MNRFGIGILLLLSLCATPDLVNAQDGGQSDDKLRRAEIAQFLGKWEGTLEQEKRGHLVPRTMRMDVRAVEGEGYRASIFLGELNPGFGILRSSRPSEKEHKAKFRRINKAPCMIVKIGRCDYQFTLKGDKLYGVCAAGAERFCTLARP